MELSLDGVVIMKSSVDILGLGKHAAFRQHSKLERDRRSRSRKEANDFLTK
jgi:hypothetical protein